MEHRSVMALCATSFAIAGLCALMVFGDDTVRRLALLAAIFAAMGQFTGQDQWRPAQIASVVMSYIAFGLALAAIATL